MTTLYELKDQYLALAELADDPNLPPEVLKDSLEGLEGEIELKSEAILQVVAGMEGDTKVIDGEIKRLQARKKSIENRATSLREYLRSNMEMSGIKKISCPLFSITLKKPMPIVVIHDENKIPKKYLNIQEVRKPLKADILKALKKGHKVSGCELSEGKPGLLVR